MYLITKYVTYRGKTFRKAYRYCKSILAACDCPVLAISATLTESESRDLQTFLGVFAFEKLVELPNRYQNLKSYYISCEKEFNTFIFQARGFP